MKDNNNNYKYTRKYTKACHHIFMESIKVYSKLNKTGLFIIPFCFTHYFIPEYFNVLLLYTFSQEANSYNICISLWIQEYDTSVEKTCFILNHSSN